MLQPLFKAHSVTPKTENEYLSKISNKTHKKVPALRNHIAVVTSVSRINAISINANKREPSGMFHTSIKTLIIVAIFMISQNANAASLWMSDNDLRTVFEGREVSGQYNNGVEFTENYNLDGTLNYNEPGRQSSGRWSITSGTFCTIYDEDTTGGCFQVSRTGSNCFEFYFVARSRQQAAAPEKHAKPTWSARAWHTDKQPTCQDETSV